MLIKVNKKIGPRRVQFTPYWFEQAYKNWQQGNPSDVVALMESVEADSFIYGCLEGRRSGVAKPIVVKPLTDSQADIDQANWLKNTLQPLAHANLLEDYQSTLFYGFTVVDFDWEVVNGRIVPVRHKALERKYFRRDPKTKELKVDFGSKLEDIAPGTQVIEFEKMPVLLPTAEVYIRMRFGEDAWSAFLESFGMPYILVYYPHGAEQEAKDEAEEVAENLAQNARATAPDLRDINGNGPVEIIESAKQTGDHEAFVKNLCQRKISLNILGHANAAEESSGMKVGENQAPLKAAEGVANKDCLYVQLRLQELANMIWGMNFGGDVPQVLIDTKPPISQDEFRLNVEMALRYKMPVSRADIMKLGLQVPDDVDWFNQEPTPFD